jgi:hypothetical protein
MMISFLPLMDLASSIHLRCKKSVIIFFHTKSITYKIDPFILNSISDLSI